MNDSDGAFNFRPPQRRRGLRLVLGSLLTILGLGGVLIGGAVLWLPQAITYEVDGETLAVSSGFSFHPRLMATALSDVLDARAEDLQGGRKVAGTNMPGYCTGRFRFSGLGTVRLAGDCGREAVVLTIRDDERPWVLTPQDRGSFLAALGGEGRYAETINPATGGIGMQALKAVTAVVLLAVLFIPVLFFVSPNRLRYRIAPSRLEIDLTIGTKSFEIGNCIARLHRPESSRKLIGSSFPGYHSGRFTVDGMTTRVYATDLGEGVLVEGPDLRLYVNPEDPHAFLAALGTYGNVAVE